MIPMISVKGNAFERGRMYGVRASSRIAGSLALYKRVFLEMAAMDWSSAVLHGLTYAKYIEQYGSKYLDEMHGIAEGANVDFGDIMALNSRTEIMETSRKR